MKKLSILLIVVLAARCGYARSGKWENDEGNWSRAFQSTKPEDVVVVHSLLDDSRVEVNAGTFRNRSVLGPPRLVPLRSTNLIYHEDFDRPLL